MSKNSSKKTYEVFVTWLLSKKKVHDLNDVKTKLS